MHRYFQRMKYCGIFVEHTLLYAHIFYKHKMSVQKWSNLLCRESHWTQNVTLCQALDWHRSCSANWSLRHQVWTTTPPPKKKKQSREMCQGCWVLLYSEVTCSYTYSFVTPCLPSLVTWFELLSALRLN